jgi:DNA-binding response OmpR family regulator
MNIILITASSEIIKKVSEIFASGKITGKHQLKILNEPPEGSGSAFEEGFLIADVCSGGNQDDKLFSFLKSSEAADLPKLVIISAGKSIADLIKNGVKINDFVFKENLDAELGIRIENIFLKDFKLNSSNSIVTGEMILDLDKYELLINGKKIELTFKEYELLKILLENKNKVFTRTQLLSAVWDYDYYGGSRTVDVHMRRLRSKMDLPYSDMLKTIRNVGYMFSPEVD